MRTVFILGLIVCTSLAVVAADMPNMKEGLWQMTVSTGGMGMPSDAMANMPADQRAMVEQMMKQKGISMNGNTVSVKSCETKDKISKGAAFADSRKSDSNCTHSMVKSSASHMEMTFHCDSKDGTTDGKTSVDVLGMDNVKGTTHMTIVSGGNTKTMDSTFTSKYLGADCGDIK